MKTFMVRADGDTEDTEIEAFFPAHAVEIYAKEYLSDGDVTTLYVRDGSKATWKFGVSARHEIKVTITQAQVSDEGAPV